jgi:hypothetical protein
MKTLLLRNLYPIILVCLLLPALFLLPVLDITEESTPFAALLLLLVIGVLNFLSIMLIVFILYGQYGVVIAASSFAVWAMIGSLGTVGTAITVCLTAGYWLHQRKYITKFAKQASN